MEIRKLDRDRLGPDNNYSQRLLPWPVLNSPFEAAWSVIRPGTASTAHAHHEYEIFIAVSGSAELLSEGEQVPFVEGDVVHFPPHTEHQVVNNGDTDFQMYSVWWDREMADGFAHRDGEVG